MGHYDGNGHHSPRAARRQGNCVASQTGCFSPGSHISVTAKLREQADAYHFGCFDNFSLGG
jgi:hypothetical protein